MGTVTTQVYGLTAPDDNEPLANVGAAMRASNAKIEAALLTKALAPQGATDYATLQGRMASMYKVTPIGPIAIAPAGSGQTLAYATNWSHWDTATTGFEAVRISKDAQGLVTLTGLAKNTAALSGNVLAMILPAAYRPRTTALCMIHGVAGETPKRMDVLPDGTCVVFAGTVGTNGFWNMNCSWRSADSNTSTTT